MAEDKVVRFPLKLDEEFNREIDDIVHEIKKTERKYSKQQFCLDAIREKIDNEITTRKGRDIL